MDSLKLAGTLPPEEDRNGLDSIASEVVADPSTQRVFLIVADCKQVTERPDIGDKTGTLRIRRIEPLTEKDLDTARRMWQRAVDKRLGKNALPIAELEDLDAAFGSGEQ